MRRRSAAAGWVIRSASTSSSARACLLHVLHSTGPEELAIELSRPPSCCLKCRAHACAAVVLVRSARATNRRAGLPGRDYSPSDPSRRAGRLGCGVPSAARHGRAPARGQVAVHGDDSTTAEF